MKKQFKKANLVKVAVVAVVGAVALAPIGASAITANSTISSAVAPVISMTTSGTVNLNVTPTSGGAQVTGTDSVNVITNNSAGYKLSLNSSDATTALTNASADTIAAATAVPATPAALAVNTWGWRVDGVAGFGTTGTDTWAGVTTTAYDIKTTTTETAGTGEATSVQYAVKVDLSKPSGTYTDVVTYTAVTN